MRRRAKKAEIERRRAPTYGAATRLARIVFGLIDRPYGWSFDAIQNELRISERTLLRYLAACREELVDERGLPILDIVRRADRRILRLAASAHAQESSAYEVLFLYFALSIFRFLDGTILKDGVDGLWERLHGSLPKNQQARLADFERKFFAVESGVKDYREFDDRLDRIVRALVDQKRLRVDYAGLLGDGHVHDFDAYTLLMYRGGLYLIGRSHLIDKIIYLAVERIRSLETLDTHFDYPRGYSPQKHTEGVFGIVDGPDTEVILQLLNPETAAYLGARRLHPTQKFRKRADGTVELGLKVRGTTELVHWILGFGPYVKVLKPKSLAEEVREALQSAVKLYA